MHQEGHEDEKQAVCVFRARDRMGRVIQGGPRDNRIPAHPELRISVAHGWALWPVKCFPHPPFHGPSAEPWEKHPHLTEENTEAQISELSSEVANVITGRTETRILEEQVWARPYTVFRCTSDLGRRPALPPLPHPTPHLPAIAPYLRVKCSRLGLEGEEELGAR